MANGDLVILGQTNTATIKTVVRNTSPGTLSQGEGREVVGQFGW
jgi:hypothetical protein